MALEDWTLQTDTVRLLEEYTRAVRNLPEVLSGDGNKAMTVDPTTLQYVLRVIDAAYVGAPTTARQIATGLGLSGGGSLAADRTIALDLGDVAAVTTLEATDRIILRDVSAAAPRYVTPGNLFNALGLLTALASPESGDWLPILDTSASGAAKLLDYARIAEAARGWSLQAYSTSATGATGWLPPTNLIAVLAIATAGGGGGGAAKVTGTTGFAGGGGGGAGATAWGLFTSAQLASYLNGSSRVDVTIGTGGTAGSGVTPSAGGTGGSTVFGPLAAGALTVVGGTGGLAGNAGFGSGRAGGAAPTTGTIKIGGSPGHHAWLAAAAGPARGGHGAASFWGGGGNGASTTTGGVAGGSGTGPGAGGSGAAAGPASSANGGAGSPGQMVLLALTR